MELSEKDIELVKDTIAQWERIESAFSESLKEGQRVYRFETNACRQQQRICRLREEHDLEAGRTMADMSICRKCPIVLATRRTCHWNISKYWEHDLNKTFSHVALAQEFSRKLIEFLRFEVLNG